ASGQPAGSPLGRGAHFPHEESPMASRVVAILGSRCLTASLGVLGAVLVVGATTLVHAQGGAGEIRACVDTSSRAFLLAGPGGAWGPGEGAGGWNRGGPGGPPAPPAG